MAETNIHQYTVQEKLNKMDIDLIDVSPTCEVAGESANELIVSQSNGVIPNAVAVGSGTSLLQSMLVMCKTETLFHTYEIIFYSSSVTTADLKRNILGTINISLTEARNTALAFENVENIGLVLQGDEDKKVYFTVYNKTAVGSGDHAADELTFRFGIMKD